MASVKETQAGSSLSQEERGRSTGEGPVFGTARGEEGEEEAPLSSAALFFRFLSLFSFSPPPPPSPPRGGGRSSAEKKSLSRIGATTSLRGWM